MMRQRRRFAIRAAALLLSALCLVIGGLGCKARQPIAQQRIAYAQTATGEILLGIVDSIKENSKYWEGISLAAEELNQAGGVLGRPLKLLYADDRNDLAQARRIAKELAARPDVTAVLGHFYSNVAIPVSIIYEHAALLFLSPWATQPNLTKYGNQLTFRNIPNDDDAGAQLANFLARGPGKRVAVIYERCETARRLADVVKAQLDHLGLEVVATRSYFPTQTDFRAMLAELKQGYTFEQIFLAADNISSAAELIREVRAMGIEFTVGREHGKTERLPVRIVGSDALDSYDLIRMAGKASEGVILPTPFNPKYPSKATREFVKRFQARFGVEPDTGAAQGYDAIQVFASAIQQTGSIVPLEIGATLRFLADWHGVTGQYAFTPRGDITGKELFFKMVQNGAFAYLPAREQADAAVDPLYVVEDTTLRLSLARTGLTLDPARAVTVADFEVQKQLFLALTDLEPGTYNTPQPVLATRWECSADGLTYRFFLRHDVVWTDGTPVTAQDVVWTLQRHIDPATAATMSSLLYVLQHAKAIQQGERAVSELGVRAIDDWTVEFTLAYPAAYFPALLHLTLFAPLPRHVLETYGAAWTNVEHIQSTGPYRLVSWQKDMLVVLRRNPRYYAAERVAIPEVRYATIPNAAIALAMYEQNELDIVGSPYNQIPDAEIPRIQQDATLGAEFSIEPSFCTVAYTFNTSRPPLNQPLVRKAIAAAIDRDLFTTLTSRGHQQAAATFTSPALLGTTDLDVKLGIPFFPVQAKRWLAEAGYPNGQGLRPLTLLYSNAQPDERTDSAVAIRDFLKYHLNITVELQNLPWEQYLALSTQPDAADLVKLTWCADYADPHNFLADVFEPENPQVYTGWDSPEFHRMLAQAVRTADPLQRQALYRRAEQLLMQEEAVLIPLSHETMTHLVKPRVKGWSFMAIGGQQIQNWSLE